MQFRTLLASGWLFKDHVQQLGLDRKPREPSRFHILLLMGSSGRPFPSAIAGALSLSVVWIHYGFSARGILVGLVMSVVTMFGFVVNDIIDYNKDASAGVKRPIAKGSKTPMP